MSKQFIGKEGLNSLITNVKNDLNEKINISDQITEEELLKTWNDVNGSEIPNMNSLIHNHDELYYRKEDIDEKLQDVSASEHTHDINDINGVVPLTRTINGKSLDNDISLTYEDVNASSADHTHKADDIENGTMKFSGNIIVASNDNIEGVNSNIINGNGHFNISSNNTIINGFNNSVGVIASNVTYNNGECELKKNDVQYDLFKSNMKDFPIKCYIRTHYYDTKFIENNIIDYSEDTDIFHLETPISSSTELTSLWNICIKTPSVKYGEFVNGFYNTVAPDEYTIVSGSSNNVNGENIAVIGSSNNVKCNNAKIYGNSNKLSSVYSGILGDMNDVQNGSYNEIIGNSNTVTNSSNSVITGTSNICGVSRSIVNGYGNMCAPNNTILKAESITNKVIKISTDSTLAIASNVLSKLTVGMIGYVINDTTFHTLSVKFSILEIDIENNEITTDISDNNVINNRTSESYIVFPYISNSISNSDGYVTIIGNKNISSGTSSLVTGYNNVNKGRFSLVAGANNMNIKEDCGMFGYANINKQSYLIAGRYNNPNVNSNLFLLGNGSSDTARSNALRVDGVGAVFAQGAFNTTGADYSEYFEYEDGNPNKDDRRGLFVTLDGSKIRLANADDDFILGIISGNPSIIGDSYDDQWNGMYEVDEFGTPVMEEVLVPEKTIEEPDPDNPDKTIKTIIQPEHTEIRQKINPNYDSTQKYIPRSQRPEWAVVGMMGKLTLIDDGTCEVNGYARPSKNGIATKAETRTGFRVMERISDTKVRVLMLPNYNY